jgi:ABC-type polysaccharide/polyol phosphate transport system ATPase subunit
MQANPTSSAAGVELTLENVSVSFPIYHGGSRSLKKQLLFRGSISPMFDITLGIDSEISGFDNIRLRGLILGLDAREIEGRMADIVEFTELGDYLDIPVRTYSSGMMTRLTFAVTTCFAPEILLMDEWIIAGDAGFLKKAQRRIEAFLEKTSIVVLASHSEEICRRWCNKAVWMERGEVKAFGEIGDILDAYAKTNGALPS